MGRPDLLPYLHSLRSNDAYVTFNSAASEYDLYASAITSFGYSSALKRWGVSNYVMYTKPVAYPEALAPFTDINPQLFNTLRTSNLSDFAIEQSGYSPRGQRYVPVFFFLPIIKRFYGSVHFHPPV